LPAHWRNANWACTKRSIYTSPPGLSGSARFPCPGSYAVISLIFAALSIKFLFASPWTRAHAGIILSHLGVLFLLLGGIVTALGAQESFMVIPEGESRAFISSYHDRVLAVETGDGALVAAYPLDDMKPGNTIAVASLPLTLRIDTVCRHCTAKIPEETTTPRNGLAAKMDLIAAPLQKDDEMNLSGVTFTLSGAREDQDGTYITLEDVPVRPVITVDGVSYTLYVRRAQTPLPFSIHLQDFVQDLYPGTGMARAYHSDVIVEDGGVQWPARIEMNAPLRYKGYTFYQSSFTATPDGKQQTVLSVVRNAARAFPYVASAIILAGLLLHLFIRLRRTAREDRA
jgi:hypothetical protein